MSDIETFFRHCPGCGRRFHVKLIRKEKTDDRVAGERLTPMEAEMDSGLMHDSGSATLLSEGPTVVIDVEHFTYTYKCAHCGHQWSEIRERERKVEV